MTTFFRPAVLKRSILFFAVVLVAMSLFVTPVSAAHDRPNIILILTDDQGYQDLGCFGSKTIKTPNLDRMATEGLRLTSFYAQPVCGVSRAALMTGSYPIRVADPNNVNRLHTVPHPQEVTMAEVLKDAGYATGMLGKWHLALDRKDLPTGVGPATMPNAQGFDYFYGTPKYNGFTVYVDEHKIRSPIMRNQEVVVEAVESWDRITADYTDEAIKWIKVNRNKPFFLYLAHNMPHIPLGASKQFKGTSDGGFYGDTIEQIDGKDATEFLTGNTKASPRNEYLYDSGCLLTGVRSGSWKLVLPRPDAPKDLGWWGRMIEAVPQTLLFDLKADPGETTNVATAHPEVVAALMKRIARARTTLGDIDQVSTNARFFDQQPRTLQVPIKKPVRQANRAGTLRHRFIAFGQKTYIADAAGKATWSYPHATRDGYVLANGNIVLTLSKGKRYAGGAVIEITPDGKETLIWKGTQSEVNSAHPTDSGTFVITEAGDQPRLLEVNQSGKLLVQFPLTCQTGNHHLETRMARKLPDGTYLAPHLLDFAVRHYDANGKVLGSLDTTVPGDIERRVHTWPFTAIRHGDGHTLVCCTNGNRVVDFDATGKVVWTLTNEDLPGPWLQDPCGGQVLPNGNIVIASYAGGRKDPRAPKLIEVTREKKVVWTYSDGQRVGIHHFQILDTNGKKLKGPALK